MKPMYKHRMRIEFDVESELVSMPTNAEIASALFQMRHEKDLTTKTEQLEVEEMELFRKFEFEDPITFGGHKHAFSVTMKLPIYDYNPTRMDLHYYNDGTDIECHREIQRRLYEEKTVKGMKHMYFRYENTKFEVIVNEEDVVGRNKFAFKQK